MKHNCIRKYGLSFAMLWLSVLSLTARSVSGKLLTGELMSSSTVLSLCQDQTGFLWIGTDYGLNRFDGYHFSIYQHSSNDSTSLPHNEVLTLLSDSQDRLWIGMGNGLARFDAEHNCFINLRFPNGGRPRVNSLIETHEGDIYVGTAGGGVFVLRKDASQLVRDEALNALTQDNFLSRLCEDADGNIWGNTRENVFYCIVRNNGEARTIRKYNLPEGHVQGFLVDTNGRLLALFPKAIMVYDKMTDKWQDAGYHLAKLAAVTGFTTLQKSRTGNLLLATESQGVQMIDQQTGNTEEITLNDQKLHRELVSATKLLEDRDGNLWASYFRKGLALLNMQNAVFHSYILSSQSEQITDIQLSSLTLGNDGSIWCSSWNKGLFRIDTSGKITPYPNVPTSTTTILCDADGQYWIGAEAGLYQFNTQTGASRLVASFPGWTNMLCDDCQGHIFASDFGKGIVRYDKQTGETRRYSASDRNGQGHLANNWVGYMFADSRGHLWISTAKGVSCLDLRTDNFQPFGWDAILEDAGIGPICEDRSGNIVIGTFSGLYLYDTKQNKLSSYPHSEPLMDKTICGLACDREGDLWISTPMGIWQYASARQQFVPYHKGSGQVSREYVQNLIIHSADDLIGFGISDGVTLFRPQEVKESAQQIGRVYLSEASINGRWTSPSQQRIVIPYDENSFSLSYSLLKYENVEAVSYEYRLNQGPWQANANGSGNNILTFNHMRPGTYEVEVRATIGEHNSSANSLLTVIVEAPWYASTAAYMIYIILVLAILALALSYYMRKKRMQLDEEKMRFLMNATHDIRSPLTLIMGPLGKLKDYITDEKGRAYLDTIDRNAQKLMMLVNQILDERKIDKGQMQLKCQETNIVNLVSGICKLYQYEAQQRNISFTFEHELNNVPLWVDRMNFDKVISNLLSNAFKYTCDSGEVRVVVSLSDKSAGKQTDKNVCYIQVIDNGVGFKEGESTKYLFERFHQGSNTVNLNTQGTGIGLNLCRSIVEMHGGHIKAENRTDGVRGACFTVTLPLGSKHLKPEQIVENKNRNEVLSTTSANHSRKNLRVMLVDDDPDIPDYIRFELGSYYNFTVCPNGQEALKTLLTDDKHYDIVVSDVMMPEMDGITLLKRIKENPHTSEIPVILLTSKTEVEFRLEGLKKGADAYLAKPFDMEELHVQIDNLVGNMRRLRGVFTGASSQRDKIENVEVKGNDDALMERVMKSINTNLSDPDYNVESLAKDVGLSRAQLHRKMKEMTGLATGKFVRDIRMQQAARLIREGRVNISQVAYSVGFNDQAHFSTVFKTYYGMTPSDYANQPDNATNQTNII